MVDVTNFVNVNLIPHKVNLDEGTRPEVLLICSDVTEETVYIGESKDSTSDSRKFIKIGEEEGTNVSGTLATYLHIFFANNGVRVKVVKEAPNYSSKDYLENIVIASTGTLTVDPYDEKAGIYKKLFVTHVDDETAAKAITAKNEAIKIGPAGYEMAIAAYLSKMKVYTEGSPVDYDFTAETEVEDQSDTVTSVSRGEDLADINYNFDMQVGDQLLNIGGNMADGSDLVEYYVMIILQQTVTNAAFKALSGKLYGQAGVAKLKTAIAAELNKYVASKFLVTNQVWTESNFYKTMGGHNELIVEKNTPISSGYIIHTYVLRDPRRAYIYLLLTTARGIRYVEIKGEYGAGGVQ